jgi:hypothetical protein
MAHTQTQWNVQTEYNSTFVAPSQYLLEPEVRKNIFDAYREDTLFDFLVHSNRTEVSKSRTYRWHEHDYMFHIHTVESFTGTGAGVPIVVTLEEADHLQTGTLSEPKLKDQVIVYTTTGPIQGYVIAVSKGVADAHVVTIDPIDDTVNLGSLTTIADKIAIMSSAASDGAAMTLPTSRLPVDYFNYVQIIDTQKTVDGQESAQQSFVMVDGKPYYYNQMVVDGDLEQRLKIDYTGLLGRRGSKADPVTSKTAYFNGGIEWSIDTDGYSEPYAGAFGLTDLQNICKNLDIERAPNKQLFLTGNNIDRDVDDFVKGRLDNTAVNWAEMGVGSAASRMIDFGIDGFRYNGRVFMKQKLSALNYGGITGTATSPYPDMAFVLPWDRAVDANGDKDSISLRYLQNDKGSRFMRFWTRDEKITNTDQFEFNWKSEMGIQFVGARHANKAYKAS